MSETNQATTGPGSIIYTPRDPLDRLQEMLSTALRLYADNRMSDGSLTTILELAHRAMRPQCVAFDPTAPVVVTDYDDSAATAPVELGRFTSPSTFSTEEIINEAPHAAKIRERLVANALDDAAERERALNESLFKDVKSPPLTLNDVLDVYRLEGRAAGAQVLTPEHVVVWVGDIEPALDQGVAANIYLWRTHDITPLLFHDCRGFDALGQGAKWLLDQRELRS